MTLMSVIRTLSRSMSSSAIVRECREIQIPVPWGHIAGKEWGNEDGEPWIALHGWLDNCGSFDKLLPYFPKTQRIIAIDLPGHGLSSHFQPGVTYHYLDGLQYIRRVAIHFNLEKFNLIGHSMGGGMSLMYSVTHPEHVNRLVMLDAIKPISRSIDSIVQRTRASVDDLLSIENKLNTGKSSHYTYEMALKRLLEGSHQLHGQESITDESAKILLQRGLKKVSESDADAWEFTRDLRHRATSLYGYPQEVMRHISSEIKCPHLIIKAKQGNLYELSENVKEVLDIYKDSNPLFKKIDVEGNHHVHLNTPQNVWPHIEDFLGKTNL